MNGSSVLQWLLSLFGPLYFERKALLTVTAIDTRTSAAMVFHEGTLASLGISRDVLKQY